MRIGSIGTQGRDKAQLKYGLDVYKRQLYIEPFRKAFCEAGALGVMSSYNDYDGERCV